MSEKEFQNWFCQKRINFDSNIHKAGLAAEETVAESFFRAGLKAWASAQGSQADLSGIDLIVIEDSYLRLLQIKAGSGYNFSSPKVSSGLRNFVKDRGLKLSEHIIHVMGDVFNGEIDHKELIDALHNEKEVIVWAK